MKSRFRPDALLIAGALVLAACQASASGSPPASEASGGGAPSGSALTGDIQISGSSTVLPISSLVFEAFTARHPGVTGFVDGPGTGDGFALFCNDEIDIADASRQISEEEVDLCEDAAVEWVELKVAIDGISVITSAGNPDLDCLSFLDLYALMGPESQGFETWSDANSLAEELADELGTDFGESHAPHPDVPLTVTAPGEESGTYDSFVDLAFGNIAEARGQDAVMRPDYRAVPKPFSRPELLARVEAVLRRDRRDGPGPAGDGEVLASGSIRVDRGRREAYGGDAELDLTTKEFDLLAFFVANPGQIFTRTQLLARIWGYDYDGTDRTIDVHVSWLRTKLRAIDGHDYFRTVRGVGYAFRPRP